MTMIQQWATRLSLLFLLLCMSAGSALAGQVNITSAFSGIWDQPDHRSQGFILQISESDDDGMIGVVYWFTYDDDLTPAWYLAVGPVTDNEIAMKLYRADGIAFLEDGIEGDPNVEEVGTLLMAFQNCNQGTVAFDTPEDVLGTGEVRIKRLTSLYRQRCSGGISDNTPNDKRPVKLELELEPVDPESDAEGKVKFWERPGRSDLHVDVEDLPDGAYLLAVCEAVIEDVELIVEDDEGSLKFRSPQSPGKEFLNFEPRECRFDILDGDTVVLTSGDDVLAPKTPGRDEDDDDDDADETEIEIDLESTGALAGAKGSASLEEDDDGLSFKVKVQNVPEGDYLLDIDGNQVGVITVESQGNGNAPNRGELRFSEPLGFDPYGALIEIFDGEILILEGVFPEG